MLVGFFITLFGGLPIGFALALAALIFIWVEGTLPGVIFAQQMARGIDNFVLLAIPFFILVGYLMEANGMSVRLIELLQRAVGPHARRPQRRHGDVDGAVFRHLRLQDGRCRGGRIGADPGGPPLPAKSGQRGGAAGGLRRDGGNHSALHQPDHPGLRRQPVDRRIVRRRPAAGRADGAGADRGVDRLRKTHGVAPRTSNRETADDGPLERRDRLVRADLHDFRWLQERVRHRHGNLGVRRGLCPRHRQPGVPRARPQDRGATASCRRRRVPDWCCSSSPPRNRSPSS